MKTKLILASCIASALTTTAQVVWPGASPGKGYTQSTIRVGGTANPATGTTFHVGNGSGSLHYVSSNDGTMQIKGANGDRALLELEDPSSTNKTIFQSLSYGTYLNAGVVPSTSAPLPIFLQGQGGRIGINNYSPAYAIDLSTGTANDGISITQTSSQAAALHLSSSTSGGRHWAAMSTGAGSAQGAGNFSIYDYNAGLDRLFINTGGNVAIGSTNPLSKLYVTLPTGVAIRGDVNGTAVAGNGIGSGNVGVTTGIRGAAYDGASNYAGYFEARGGASGVTTYGLYSKINFPSLGGGNYGVYSTIGGVTYGGAGPAYAGYFDGDLVVTAGCYYPSDRRIKKDVANIHNSMDIISKLNPVTYNFITEANKNIALPASKQYGFISQEIQEILPELTRTIVHPAEVDEKGNEISPAKEILGLNYNGFIAILAKGIQEQQAHINLQDQEMAELKSEINRLKSANATGIDQNNPGANGFAMSQNEPNPFSQETVVKYTLPQSVNSAFMAVYDLTGKQITTLPVTEKGSSAITITSEKLSAGIYIYTIVADGKVVDSKRMIVAEKH